jgi:hypothetical protein
MEDAIGMKIGVETFIFTTPIGLNDNDLFVKQSLHKLLKFKETFRHLRFMAKQINLHEFAIIINKTHVIFLIPKQSFCQAMFHKLLKFKEIFRHLRFMTKQINLHEFAIIINKTHVIFFLFPNRSMVGPHTSEKNELLWSRRTT